MYKTSLAEVNKETPHEKSRRRSVGMRPYV